MEEKKSYEYKWITSTFCDVFCVKCVSTISPEHLSSRWLQRVRIYHSCDKNKNDGCQCQHSEAGWGFYFENHKIIFILIKRSVMSLTCLLCLRVNVIISRKIPKRNRRKVPHKTFSSKDSLSRLFAWLTHARMNESKYIKIIS
jgi:hypothetical protein